MLQSSPEEVSPEQYVVVITPLIYERIKTFKNSNRKPRRLPIIISGNDGPCQWVKPVVITFEKNEFGTEKPSEDEMINLITEFFKSIKFDKETYNRCEIDDDKTFIQVCYFGEYENTHMFFEKPRMTTIKELAKEARKRRKR